MTAIMAYLLAGIMNEIQDSAWRSLELFRHIHPHAITTLKMDGKPVPSDFVESILGFFVFYFRVLVFCSLIVSGPGLDLVSAFASVAACIGNIGPGLGSVVPADNDAHIPVLGKWLLSLCMIVGRLEVYTLIVLFVPAFWKK